MKHGEVATSYSSGCRCEGCRETKRAQNAAYWERNRDWERARSAAYRERNRDHIRERDAAYRERNRDHIREREAAYRERNRDYIREREATYRAQNPGHVDAHRREIQRATREAAVYSGKPWTPEETRIARDPEMSITEAAFALGRTYTSVAHRRQETLTNH